MARRKAPVIPDEPLDQLLAGRDPQAALGSWPSTRTSLIVQADTLQPTFPDAFRVLGCWTAAVGLPRRRAASGVGETLAVGTTPDSGVFGSLLVTALWLAAAGLLRAWWSDGEIGWATLWEALAAAGIALWALGV